ncbi:MAG: T9SS type A sorting domain-containing protein [Flavobacteriales bacterium]|nr:T9SS type A sorting domain-containing protein [Flavobacteriales bacterium]
MHQATGGEWVGLGQSDRDQLRTHALSGRTGAAWAWSILTALEEEVPLPPVRFPVHTKNRRAAASYEPADASTEPAIACFPNPSNANTFVTYPSHLDGTALLIMDAKDELVRTVILQNQGVLDLNTRELPAGLYLLTVAGTSFSTKLTVQR